MSITGGIISTNHDIELSISISGGKSYKRVYNDVVSTAINKFTLIGTTLGKILIAKTTSRDIKFYVDQIKLLLARAHVELIDGDLPFHDKYNMWLLDGYIRMVLETMDMKLVAQLLDIDSILYSIEEASLNQNEPIFIDFNLPSNIHIQPLSQIDPQSEIAIPVADELSAYLFSLNRNIALLTFFITANKPALIQIHKNIITTACKHLS